MKESTNTGRILQRLMTNNGFSTASVAEKAELTADEIDQILLGEKRITDAEATSLGKAFFNKEFWLLADEFSWVQKDVIEKKKPKTGCFEKEGGSISPYQKKNALFLIKIIE